MCLLLLLLLLLAVTKLPLHLTVVVPFVVAICSGTLHVETEEYDDISDDKVVGEEEAE